jgi:hypothetical protein
MSETTPNVWPLPDVQRARDYLEVALSVKAVLMQHEVELLADLDAECARRTGSTPTALDRLLWNSRRCQTQRERTIAAARRRLPLSTSATAEPREAVTSTDALAGLRVGLAAAEIRRELHTLTEQRAVTIQQRDLVAFDAVRDEAASLRWQHLGDTATALEQRIDVLRAALPQAEAREREAAERAEAVRREQAVIAYRKHLQEAERIAADMIASLPHGEALTRLRDLRDGLSAEARDLGTWSRDHDVRRPFDPLAEVLAAMQHRIARVERARHAGSHPITLGGATTQALAEAAARVDILEEGVRK